MEQASVLLARAVAWVEPVDLNKGGRVFYPALVKAVVERYNFQKFPQQMADFDETKGVTFGGGRWGDYNVDQLILYKFGIVLDTSSDTSVSQNILKEGLEWAAKHLGLTYQPAMIKRWQYASQVTFYSDVSLLEASPAFKSLADNLGKITENTLGEELKYDVAGLFIDYDQLKRKHPLGRFSIQRRDNTPFSENKFFSEAPVQTHVHLNLLRAFERELSGK
jgi:hypothetical protein